MSNPTPIISPSAFISKLQARSQTVATPPVTAVVRRNATIIDATYLNEAEEFTEKSAVDWRGRWDRVQLKVNRRLILWLRSHASQLANLLDHVRSRIDGLEIHVAEHNQCLETVMKDLHDRSLELTRAAERIAALEASQSKQDNLSSQNHIEHLLPHAVVGPDTVVARLPNMSYLYLDSKDCGITPRILIEGKWEPLATRILESTLRPGDRMLDVGAHVGYFAMIAAPLVGDTGKIIAVEPNPEVYRYLLNSTRANNFGGRIDIRHIAVGKERRDAVLHIYQRSQGSTTESELPARLLGEIKETPLNITVPMLTIDDLGLEAEGTFRLIKMDIEGGEISALRGAKQFLSRCFGDDSVLLVECNPPALQGLGGSVEELIKELIPLGTIYRI
jgi:FkbM family methyltransferase